MGLLELMKVAGKHAGELGSIPACLWLTPICEPHPPPSMWSLLQGDRGWRSLAGGCEMDFGGQFRLLPLSVYEATDASAQKWGPSEGASGAEVELGQRQRVPHLCMTFIYQLVGSPVLLKPECVGPKPQ